MNRADLPRTALGGQRIELMEELYRRYGVRTRGPGSLLLRFHYWRKKYAWLAVVGGAKLLKRTIDVVVLAARSPARDLRIKGALDEALSRLMGGLAKNGIRPAEEPFRKAYREAALRHIKKANENGVETHNRFWISEALQRLGYDIGPEDLRISSAIESYFSAFLDFCHLIPDTLPMLRNLKTDYCLGLLSNFTHAPAAVKLIHHLGLDGFFEAVLISGQVGFRKPHFLVFQKLLLALGVNGAELLYVGDDPEADVRGALNAGIQPIWFTHPRQVESPLPPGAVSDPSRIPSPDIPAISNWGELLSFLHR